MKAQNVGHLMFQLHSFERQKNSSNIYWLLVTVARRICRLVAFCLLPTKPTQAFSPRQVWERHGTERAGMVASKRAIYPRLSATPDPGRARRILTRQHHCDGQSQQSGHPSHVRVWCSLSAWPTVHRWSGSQLRPSAEPPVSWTWISIFCDINVIFTCLSSVSCSPVTPPCATIGPTVIYRTTWYGERWNLASIFWPSRPWRPIHCRRWPVV